MSLPARLLWPGFANRESNWGDQDEFEDRETQLESEDRIAKANLDSGIAKRELKPSRKCSLS